MSGACKLESQESFGLVSKEILKSQNVALFNEVVALRQELLSQQQLSSFDHVSFFKYLNRIYLGVAKMREAMGGTGQ